MVQGLHQHLDRKSNKKKCNSYDVVKCFIVKNTMASIKTDDFYN